MKSTLVSIVAAVLLVGCGESQQSAPQAEPVAEVPAQPLPPPVEAKPAAEAAKPEPPTTEAPDISIHQAVFDGNIEAVKQAITDGADVNAKDSVGWTPLHLAAIYDHKETVELIIANGADVNAKDEGGLTPLHNAAYEGHKEIVELLIANGADVNPKRDDGKTPLDMAVTYKQTETADLLRKHGGKTGEELKADGSEANYSGNYYLTIQGITLNLELKIDGSFIGKASTDKGDDVLGSWVVKGDLLICEGMTKNTKTKIGIKFNKTTLKLVSLSENGKEEPNPVPEGEDGIFKKN